MYAALYGELLPQARPDPEAGLTMDAYGLFYARSAAMGWLTPAEEGATRGLWGMNDAEAVAGSGPRPARVAFFQVVLTGPARGELLPVQQFLACAGDVLARLGTLRLDAVQIVLPEHDADADAQMDSPLGLRMSRALLEALNWFGDVGPRSRVRVTLDGLADPAIRAAAPGIAGWVQGLNQEVFDCDSFSLADEDHLVLGPDPVWTWRPEGEHNRVTLRGTLADWSLDAVGWLAAFLTDGGARHGVSTPLLLSAEPFPPAA
jgi:hypothetical protein